MINWRSPLHIALWTLVSIVVLLWLVAIIRGADLIPAPSESKLLEEIDISEQMSQLQFRLAESQREVARLTTCLKSKVSYEECGPWAGNKVQVIKHADPTPNTTGK